MESWFIVAITMQSMMCANDWVRDGLDVVLVCTLYSYYQHYADLSESIGHKYLSGILCQTFKSILLMIFYTICRAVCFQHAIYLSMIVRKVWLRLVIAI